MPGISSTRLWALKPKAARRRPGEHLVRINARVITATVPVWYYYFVEPFTHIYCTSCKAINFAKREANVITCGVCDKPVLRLDDNEHGECETCGLQSLEHKSLDSEDVSGQFLRGDILCDSCKLILAKVYKQKPGDSGQKNNAPGFG